MDIFILFKFHSIQGKFEAYFSSVRKCQDISFHEHETVFTLLLVATCLFSPVSFITRLSFTLTRDTFIYK